MHDLVFPLSVVSLLIKQKSFPFNIINIWFEARSRMKKGPLLQTMFAFDCNLLHYHHYPHVVYFIIVMYQIVMLVNHLHGIASIFLFITRILSQDGKACVKQKSVEVSATQPFFCSVLEIKKTHLQVHLHSLDIHQ